MKTMKKNLFESWQTTIVLKPETKAVLDTSHLKTNILLPQIFNLILLE